MLAFVPVDRKTALHFEIFSEVLSAAGIESFIADTSTNDLDSVIKRCATASIIFVAIGTKFAGDFVRTIDLSKRVILYYKNPGNFVYTQFAITATKTKQIVFANMLLPTLAIDLKRIEGLKEFHIINLECADAELDSGDTCWTDSLISFVKGVE